MNATRSGVSELRLQRVTPPGLRTAHFNKLCGGVSMTACWSGYRGAGARHPESRNAPRNGRRTSWSGHSRIRSIIWLCGWGALRTDVSQESERPRMHSHQGKGRDLFSLSSVLLGRAASSRRAGGRAGTLAPLAMMVRSSMTSRLHQSAPSRLLRRADQYLQSGPGGGGRQQGVGTAADDTKHRPGAEHTRTTAARPCGSGRSSCRPPAGAWR